MPFVKRKVTHTSETTFGSITNEVHLHVPAHAVKRGDVVVKHDDIPDEILADLAQTFPEEYGRSAEKRALEVAISPSAFAALSQGKAIEAIKTASADRLAGYYDTECSRIPRRPNVMRAFAERGLSPDADGVVDTSDLDDEDDGA